MLDNGKFLERTMANTIANIARTVVMALVGVMLVPYFLDTLGKATYGIIPLATTMSMYVMLVADSLMQACNRYSILAFSGGDEAEASRVFNSSYFGLARLCCMLLPVILVLSFASPYVFNVGSTAAADVQLLFLMVLTSSVVVVMASPFSSVFYAFNNIYLLYTARALYSLIQVALIVALFAFVGPSLVLVGVAYVLSSAIYYAMIYAMAKHTHPALRIRMREYDRASFREIGTLGIWTILHKVGGLLFIQASLVLSNIFVGEVAGSEFAIASSVVSMIHSASLSFTTSMEPPVYRLYAEGDMDGLRRLVRTYVRVISFMFAMPIAFAMVFAGDVLTVWVGAENAHIADVLLIALIGDVAYCASTTLECVPVILLKMERLTVFTMAFGLLNVAAAVVVLNVTDLGNIGAMAVWSVSTIALTLTTLVYNERIAGMRRGALLWPVAQGYAVFAVCLAAYWALSMYVSLAGGWIQIFVAFFLLYAVHMVLTVRILTPEERSVLAKFIPARIRRLIPSRLLRL